LNREIFKLVPLAAAEHILAVPTSEFINAKLTAKLARQLQDPLALCTNTLPAWCASLSTEMSFLFPLDLRQLYFRGSSLGVPRALLALKDRVEGVLDGNFGRITPHKVRVERDSIKNLNSAFVILQRLRNDSRSMLEVEYANEVATGAGPTLEFYTLVSHAFQQAHLGMWVPDGANKIIKHASPSPNAMQVDTAPSDSSNASSSSSTESSSSAATLTEPIISSATGGQQEENKKKVPQRDSKSGGSEVDSMHVVNNNGGLFPAPLIGSSAANEEIIRRFSFLGTFIAKAIMDDRMVDFPFSIPFLKTLLGVPLHLDDLQHVYPYLVDIIRQFLVILEEKRAIEGDTSIKSEEDRRKKIDQIKFKGKSIEDMWLTFDLPGTNVELVPGGSDKSVTIHNLEEWVDLVVDAMAGQGVRPQFEALRSGFASIFDASRLAVFAADELETLICGNVEQDWSRQAILEAANYTHGFSVNSRVSGWFATVLSEFDEEQRRKFLRFATGSPRLPPRGFKGFHHRLTLSRKDADKNHKSDDYYPSVSTCFLFIKIPDYSTFEIFKDRFLTAIENGQSGFGLS
jgi:E3 ubiquitin-protein ligase TRIP12